jgi:hypothetical protein
MHRYYTRLHPRQINRALAELGLQLHSILGWELTALGKRLGGQQEESNNTGAFFVTWPHEIVDHPVVHRELSIQSGELPVGATVESDAVATDLFSNLDDSKSVPLRGVDGHELRTGLEMQVCNWLYMAQLVHAHHRALPTEVHAQADFYVPSGSVYIDCWEADVPAQRLSGKLLNRELYREHGLHNIEINAGDSERLDEVLGRGLHSFGLRC